MFDVHGIRSYTSQDHAPRIVDASAGEPSTMYRQFGAIAPPVVTGITRPDPRPFCHNCYGSGVDGVGEDDCPVCGGCGHAPTRGLDDYSNGFVPEGDFEYQGDGDFSEAGL